MSRYQWSVCLCTMVMAIYLFTAMSAWDSWPNSLPGYLDLGGKDTPKTRFVSHSNDYLPHTLTGPRLMDRKTSAVYCYWRLEGTIAWRVMGLSQTFQLHIFISRKKILWKHIIMFWNARSYIKSMRKDPLFLSLFRWFGVRTTVSFSVFWDCISWGYLGSRRLILLL